MARYTQESREKVRDAIDFAELVGARTELKRAGTQPAPGPVPVPRGADAVVRDRPRGEALPLLRLRGGRRRLLVRDGDGGAGLRRRAGVAGRAGGVELERESEDPRDAAKRVRRDRLLALLERTAAYYVRVLWEAAEAARAREYLARPRARRGDAARVPGRLLAVALGPRADGLAQGPATPRRSCWPAGLASRSRDGSGGCSTASAGGSCSRWPTSAGGCSASARGRWGDGQQPKYLNTSDGEVFHKGRMVYGADLARAAAAKAGRVVLVEGYTDVIALRQAGVPEAVCSMGTALTPQQVDALARLAPRCCSARTPTPRARRRSAAAWRACASTTPTAARAPRWTSGSCACPRARTRPTSSRPRARTRCARLLDGAVPVPHYEVERALERRPRRHRRARRRAQPRRRVDRPARAERAAQRADQARLGPPERAATLVESVIADPAPPPRRPGAETAAADAAERRRRAPPPARRRRPRRLGRRAVVHEDPARGGLPRPQRRPQGPRPPRADRARLPRPTASRCPPRASSAWPTPTSTSSSPPR